MRSIVAAAIGALALMSLAGCSGTQNLAPEPAATSPWRVVPLHPRENSQDAPAILVNEQTGDTWFFQPPQHWIPVIRQ